MDYAFLITHYSPSELDMQTLPKIGIGLIIAIFVVCPLCYLGICVCCRLRRKVAERQVSALNQKRRRRLFPESQHAGGDLDVDLEPTIPLPPAAHVRRERPASAGTYTEDEAGPVDAVPGSGEHAFSNVGDDAEEDHHTAALDRTAPVSMLESEIDQATRDRLTDYHNYFDRVRSDIRSICESSRSIQPPPATPRLMPAALPMRYSLPTVEEVRAQPLAQPQRSRAWEFARSAHFHEFAQHQTHREYQPARPSPQGQPIPLFCSHSQRTPLSAARTAETGSALEAPSEFQRRSVQETRRLRHPHRYLDQTSRLQGQASYFVPAYGHFLNGVHPTREARERSRWAAPQHDEMGNRLRVPPPPYDPARLPDYYRPTRAAPPSYRDATIPENL